MNTLQDRLTTAMRAAADTVPAGSAPPLALPRASRARGVVRLSGRAWRGWLAPAAAAAAVVTVIAVAEVSSLLVRGPARQAPPAWAAGVPRYYVVLTYSNPSLGPRGNAYLRFTATGRLVATVRPPAKGTFTAVTASADDHTFVLAARMPSSHGRLLPGPLRLFRLTVGPPGRPPALTPLRQVQPPGAELTGLALSPDATKLAVALTVGYRSFITVMSMATGTVRAWSGVTPGARAPAEVPGINWITGVSWAADDRTLAYNDRYNVRILDTAAPGHRLPLDSIHGMRQVESGLRVALACSAGSGDFPSAYYGNAVLTPDASLVIPTAGFGAGRTAGAGPARTAGLGRGAPVAAVISRAVWRTGTLTYPCQARQWLAVRSRAARYGSTTGAIRWVYWAGRGGHTMIVSAYFGLGRGLVGVLRGSTFTPLPGSSRIPVSPEPPGAPAAW